MDYSLKQRKREKNAHVSTSKPFVGKFINMRIDNVKYSDGSVRNLEIVEHPGGVLIIPVASNGNIVFIKQYRTIIDQILIELPAGLIEKNEDPLQAAQRELEEETGYKSNNLISLSGIYSSPGFCTEYIHIFIAKELSVGIPLIDEDEGIDNIELSLSDACDMIGKSQIIDAKTIVAIFKFMASQKGI